MSLEAGSYLGPYVIVAPLGEGGMGEVYRARDSRLGRTVAIKTIRQSALATEHARDRFQREARTISALTHPNICTLHDVGQQNGIDYLVMEHLEGESLADRLAKGPLPLADVLRYGTDIAAALDHAHRHGVIHRDLKPGNILITKSSAKLLDFGLARIVRGDEPGDKDGPTIEKPLTSENVVPGTLQFIAPELLEGKPADERSDIFAFGNVLYRMATGRPPFHGDSAGSLIASISRDEPVPIEPPALNDLVSACLRKNPDERVQSAHDCKLALEWMQRPVSRRVEGPKTSWRQLPVAAAAIAGALAVAIFWIASARSKQAPQQVRRFSIDLPAPFDVGYSSSHLAISPDATRIVILLNGPAGRKLYMRSFAETEFAPIAGTDGAGIVFFSPDSKWIGFAADGKLKKITAEGGAPVTICSATRPRGADWGPDDTIVFSPASTDAGLYRVSAAGGEPVAVTTLDRARGERSHRWPHFLPDGKHVMFSVEDWGADYARKRIDIVDLTTLKRTTVLRGGADGRVLPGGYLLYGRDNTLLAAKFNLSTLQVTGLPVPVFEHVQTHTGVGKAYADIAGDGTLVYEPYDRSDTMRDLVWVDRDGHVTPMSDERRPYLEVSLSPDGEQLVAGAGDYPAADLWLLNIRRGSWSRIASEGKNMSPIWSPRGDQIFFASNRFGVYNVFQMAADGEGAPRQITNREYWPFPRSVSPDGRTLIVEIQHPITSQDLLTVDVASGRELPLIVAPADQTDGVFSPDGQWIAYVSTETGRPEVYVQHFPGTGRKWSVSRDFGERPRWSRDGRELFFLGPHKLMAAQVTGGPTMQIGTPKLLFEWDNLDDFGAGRYDVGADGKRFVMLRKATNVQLTQLNVVVGAADEIARRVNAGSR